MVSLLAVFAGLTAAYIVVLMLLSRRESERYQVLGPLIMLKTQAGKKLIDRIAGWRGVGRTADVFFVLTVLAGAVMIVLVVYQNILLFTHTEIVAERPPRLSETLAIPGVNPVIPVGYGLVGLVVALIIHEGGHGVLARHAGMRVKSLGLLFFVIPVGAFVEPDEMELQRARLRDKLRLFSAGPGPNIVLAMVCVMAFAQVFVPAMAPAHGGVAVLNTIDDLPADRGGLPAGAFVTSIEGTTIHNARDFTRALQSEDASNELEVTYWHRGSTNMVTLLPLDRYEYFQDQGFSDEQLEEACTNDEGENTCRGVPFLGITPAGPSELANLTANIAHPFESQGLARGSLFYVAMPFANLQPFPTTFHDIYEPTGAFEDWGMAYWVTANTLYWLFWINIVLGTFNALPFWVLDGGHMFRQSLHWGLRRRKGIDTRDLDVIETEERGPHYVSTDEDVQRQLSEVDESARVISKTLTITMLVLIVGPLIIPQFL